MIIRINSSRALFIDKVLLRFLIQNSKEGILSTRHGMTLYKKCLKTLQEIEDMKLMSYTLVFESLMYALLSNRFEICYVIGIVNRYKSNLGLDY